MFTINYRSSSVVSAIQVNPVSGHVIVNYKNGTIYSYENVNRLAIINLMMNDNISLGLWINQNLLSYDAGVVMTFVA